MVLKAALMEPPLALEAALLSMHKERVFDLACGITVLTCHELVIDLTGTSLSAGGKSASRSNLDASWLTQRRIARRWHRDLERGR
ncbi:hypothetical protein [Xylophilus sp. GOD-11R]|uniref:hypothetical protein n=1 Tax=Xylophilus sp. GOD-11R TaxID=3089814 RepID=UPI00298BEF20|nr:hypothetical protein [Xylophilus sp. GOD-11R]WPB57379.1 hypothetical protein R9X41_01620 [Xylophilus sp. GOD-11R]